jgi:predicted MFS family arabinose efflux permease
MSSLARPLRLPAFRRLAAAYGINTLGTWLGEIALTVLVLHETGSAAAVAAIWVIGQFAPSLVAPALVSRLDRLPVRRVVPPLLAAEALIFAVIAATANDFSLPLVLSLAALDSVLGLTARALLKASAVAATEPRGILREGNMILVTIFTVCAAAGPLVAGVAIAAVSVQAALVADAVSFALAALVLGVRVELPSCRPGEESDEEKGRLRAALDHVWSQPALRRLLVAFTVVAVFGAAVIPVEILLVTDTLGESEAAYGAVLAAWGIGAVAGSGLLTLLRRASLKRLMIGSFLVMAASYVGMGTASNVETVILFSALGGIGNGIEGFATATAIQEATAEAFQARVSGLVEALAAAATGAGFFLGGAIATAGSTRAVYVIGGVGILAAAAALASRPRAPRPAFATA